MWPKCTARTTAEPVVPGLVRARSRLCLHPATTGLPRPLRCPRRATGRRGEAAGDGR
jgi:hypothetical protein